MPSLYFEAG